MLWSQGLVGSDAAFPRLLTHESGPIVNRRVQKIKTETAKRYLKWSLQPFCQLNPPPTPPPRCPSLSLQNVEGGGYTISTIASVPPAPTLPPSLHPSLPPGGLFPPHHTTAAVAGWDDPEALWPRRATHV